MTKKNSSHTECASKRNCKNPHVRLIAIFRCVTCGKTPDIGMEPYSKERCYSFSCDCGQMVCVDYQNGECVGKMAAIWNSTQRSHSESEVVYSPHALKELKRPIVETDGEKCKILFA